MDKKKNKRSVSVRQKMRLLVQCVATCLCNGYVKGFANGRIYTGKGKNLCVPGMNCYSCPGAVGSCPIGSLQNALAEGQYKAVLYVLGLITLFGTLGGRLVCGFLCPFGLLQDLLHKIPFWKKVRNLPGERMLRLVRYVVLAVFVILLPMFAVDIFGLGDPWFCKYICPVGTLEAGIPLVVGNSVLREAVSWLYTWKLVILVVILLLSLMLYRPFCRYLCPLGAVYGLLNRFAVYRYEVDAEKCIRCGACQKACRMDIPVWEKPNSLDCIRCGACMDACPTGAIQRK